MIGKRQHTDTSLHYIMEISIALSLGLPSYITISLQNHNAGHKKTDESIRRPFQEHLARVR
ncbi:amino acid ABC transporter permease protein [Secundilactobacillus oryzae JCM 18671]|uniref:Amino acid ABC transporter permease protein n=1 Tax=Secundilactobacillus oryzae JCM 18671 TaxID=1291743 RepID=A0A081BH08_9LACO|nr:amino acid ABC transporter permease protein [Secundilactobacillus oryzae JCM 18671]